MGRPMNHVKGLSVEDAIIDLITERGLRPGDAIPTEPELVDAIGVGRNALREALRALRAIGVVDIRHGSGMYVGELSMEALRRELNFHGRLVPERPPYLADLIEIRDSLEQGLLSNLVTDGLMPDLDALERLVREMDRDAQERGVIRIAVDREFHQVLYEPLNNPLAGQLLGVFWDVFSELVGESEPNLRVAQGSADRHHAIVLAVRQADPRAARIAMSRHFAGLRSRLGMTEREIV